MTSAQENTLFQSEHHPLVDVAPVILEDHCLSLMHRKAYETARELARGKAVLDLGCNDGYGTAIIAEGATSAVGVDLSLKAIEAARRAYPRITFLHLTEPSLPFPDQSFDLVTAFQVIEHVADVPPFLNEVRRLLKPGGSALFTTPNRALRLLDGAPPWNPFHVREYIAQELRDTLTPHFDEVEVKGLAGNERIERIERGRLARHLRLARLARAGLPGRAAASLEYRIHRALRKAAATAGRVQLVRKARALQFSRYSTSDLHYTTTELGEALDLFARTSLR